MLQKTDPSVLIQKDFGGLRPKIQLNSSNFEIAVGLFDLNVNNYSIDSTEFEIVATQTKIAYSKVNGVPKQNENNTIFEFRKCNSQSFPFSGIQGILPEMKCLNDFQLETNGFVNELEFSAFKIDLFMCNNLTSKQKTCKPKEEILNKMQNKILGLHFIDYNINYNNFSQPILFTTQAEWIALDQKYTKTKAIFFTKFLFVDDFEMIGSKPRITESFFKNGVSADFVSNENQDPNQPLASFFFYSNPELQKNCRSYQKLTQLLANIGGSANFFISIGFVFIGFINDWTMRSSLFAKLYCLEQKNSKENEEKANNCGEKTCVKKEETKEIKTNFIENSQFQKIEMKELKPDSFVLEKYSVEEELRNIKQNTKKKKNNILSIWRHIAFKIKYYLGFKLNENNEIYHKLDNGYHNIINGNFLFKKLQELECIKKIFLSEKEIILLKNVKSPLLEFELNKLSQNSLKRNHFGLYPLHLFDEKLKKYDNYNLGKLFKEWEGENEVLEKKGERDDNLRKKLSFIMSSSKFY